MDFVQNFPFFSIILSMFSGTVSSVLPAKAAKWLNTVVIGAVGCMSAVLLVYLMGKGTSYTYMMGHFPAPWGNEIRAGVLEAGMALFFCIIMLLSLMGGRKKLLGEVEYSKHNLYYILTDLLLSSLLALVYTNDLFTAYVFVEINTISACGLIMIRQNGRTIEAAVRYMIMSLLGSGLLLVGISMLYDMTGHLLMSNIKETVGEIVAQGEFRMPLVVTIGLICVGLAIKSALFPFHSWLPDAYGYSTVSSAAMLSSLVSKGYIFLLIKIIYRVIGFDFIAENKIINVFFVFGLMGMIFGSLSAIKENDIRRMISFPVWPRLDIFTWASDWVRRSAWLPVFFISFPMPPPNHSCLSPLSALRMFPKAAGNSRILRGRPTGIKSRESVLPWVLCPW